MKNRACRVKKFSEVVIKRRGTVTLNGSSDYILLCSKYYSHHFFFITSEWPLLTRAASRGCPGHEAAAPHPSMPSSLLPSHLPRETACPGLKAPSAPSPLLSDLPSGPFVSFLVLSSHPLPESFPLLETWHSQGTAVQRWVSTYCLCLSQLPNTQTSRSFYLIYWWGSMCVTSIQVCFCQNAIEILIRIALNLRSLWVVWASNCIMSFDPRAQDVFPFMCILYFF